MNILAKIAEFMAFGRVRPADPDRRGPIVDMRLAGVPVTHDTALTSATLWACVSRISQDVSGLPWHAHRKDGDRRVADPAVEALLNRSANGEMGARSLRETIVSHAMTWGNGYAEIIRNGRGQAIEMWLITPDRVTPKRSAAGDLYYEVSPATGVAYGGGALTEIPARDMFHLRGLGWDGVRGYSVVWNAARSLGINLALDEMAASYFRNNAASPIAVEMPQRLGGEGVKRFLEEFKARFAGPRNSGTPLLLDSGAKLHKIGIPANEAQFLESRNFQVEEICRWFGVPPHMVQHLLRATFSNIEHQSQDYVRAALLPWCRRLEEEADRKLLYGYSATYTRVALQGLLRGDTAARAAFYREMRAMGVLSVNEIRALEDMDPIGPEGDVRVMQAQYVPIENLGAVTPGVPASAARVAATQQSED
jgi:HK97 family phage portal protein